VDCGDARSLLCYWALDVVYYQFFLSYIVWLTREHFWLMREHFRLRAWTFLSAWTVQPWRAWVVQLWKRATTVSFAFPFLLFVCWRLNPRFSISFCVFQVLDFQWFEGVTLTHYFLLSDFLCFLRSWFSCIVFVDVVMHAHFCVIELLM